MRINERAISHSRTLTFRLTLLIRQTGEGDCLQRVLLRAGPDTKYGATLDWTMKL
jgi:hypothetical protein